MVSELHKRRVLALIALVCGTTVVLPLVFGLPRGIGGQAGDGWRNFIYDFQTLIGGGAAIIAAWYTVRQMRISDDRSEQRHRELVSLQMRPDRLRIERLLNPSLDYLIDRKDSLASVKMDVLKELIASQPRSAVFVFHEVIADCKEVIKILSKPSFFEASDLLDGVMTDKRERVAHIVAMLRDHSQRCFEVTTDLLRQEGNDMGFDIEGARDELITKINMLRNFRDHAVTSLTEFCEGLKSMQKQYSLH